MNKLKQWISKFKKEDRQLVELLKDVEFEKNDTFALVIAALITIIPAVLFVISIFVLVIWAIFLR